MKRPERSRISALQRVMETKGIGSLLVTRREDVRYLTGFSGSAGSLLLGSKSAHLITDFRYKLQSRQETKGVSIVIMKKDFLSTLKEVAEGQGIDRIWIDESDLTVEALKKLRKTGLSVRGHGDLVRDLRIRKDAVELDNIRLALKRAEESFHELQHFIKPGVSEREVSLKLEFLMKEKGSRRAAFDTIVASGENGAMPHATVTDRRIKKGDFVTIDFGAEANGYLCDITRTVCVGRPTTRQREIHHLVLKAQEAAFQNIRLGGTCKSVDDAARDTIREAGHGSHFGHGTGHGVGLMVHEAPTVSPLSKDVIEQGMVFTVEPGVYIPGWGGVRIEDMVLVTAKGIEMMTTLPRELAC